MSIVAPNILALDETRAAVDLAVQEQTSMSGFLALETEWNALVEATDAGLFLRHECIRAWLEAFAPQARLVVLLARDRSGSLVGALPLLSTLGFVGGLPARQFTAAANTHSCRFDMIALEPLTAGRAFLAHLLNQPGWDVLRIIDVPEGGNAWEMYRAAETLGLPTGSWEGERSPYLQFPSSYAEVLAGKTPLFRANLRRRRRQLERLGALSVERVTDATSLDERLHEGFALEQRGWKGREGTAIAQDARTRAFYTRVAHDAARRGHLALFFLRLDGRPIAFHYGLVHRGVYYVPKLAYDETLVGCSPGLVLLEEAIKDGIARGLRGYDFLGAEAEWKNKWSSTVRANHWLFIFRDTMIGRTLRRSKFEWLPAARAALPRPRSRASARAGIFVPAFPTIRPEALLRFGGDSIDVHYPFSAPGAARFHFARNAIWQAVKDLGLDGGEVLVPAYHHGVEIEALIDAGARVRFYSIGPHFEVDLDEVEGLIGPDTRALYLTHFLGFPGPARAMKALARRHGLPLVEDCALSLFSADGDLPLGVTGDVAIFCLYKVLSVPDGGLLVYPDSSTPGQARLVGRLPPPPLASSAAALTSSILRNVALRGGRVGRALRAGGLAFGKGALKASRVEPVLAGTQHFNRSHCHLGPSRLTERLLRVQDVPEIVSRRRRNYLFLLERLRDLSTPLFDTLPAGVVPLCYPLLVEDNRWFMEQLVGKGIEAVDFWREGHPACPLSAFPAVARLRATVLEIPCHQDLTLDTLARMVPVIRQTFAACTRGGHLEIGRCP